MSNILDYLDWRGDILFSERPFNEVDNLILSELAYVNMKGLVPSEDSSSITLSELFKKYRESKDKLVIPMNDPEPLLERAAASDRFRNVRLMLLREKTDIDEQLQFCAVSFIIGDGSCYISFRGTDATIVGWREDCNFSFLSQTPGQLAAADYVNEAASLTDCSLRVGGHSKGGNFAVYGAAFCNEKIRDKRITEIYCNDGPGFNDNVINSEQYKATLPKIRKIIPESSLVGLLLSGAEEKTIIKSSAKGIYQHNPFSWCVTGCCFEKADGLSAESTLMNEALSKWIGELDDSDRKLFVTSVFDSIEASGALTLNDINKNKLMSYNAMMNAAKEISAERRIKLFNMLRSLTEISGEVFFNEARKKFEQIKEAGILPFIPESKEKSVSENSGDAMRYADSGFGEMSESSRE